jgi:hypothetical protein
VVGKAACIYSQLKRCAEDHVAAVASIAREVRGRLQQDRAQLQGVVLR